MPLGDIRAFPEGPAAKGPRQKDATTKGPYDERAICQSFPGPGNLSQNQFEAGQDALIYWNFDFLPIFPILDRVTCLVPQCARNSLAAILNNSQTYYFSFR
jgi:hypothetical protein